MDQEIVTSLGLKVKTPMKLYVDYHGVVDLVNKWSLVGELIMWMSDIGGSGI